MNTRSSLLMFLLIILLGLNGCGTNTKPRFPEPQIYPKAQNIVRQTQSDNSVRTISFQTTDTPDMVLTFYKESLIKEGWELIKTYPNALEFDYTNGVDNPAFSLGVIIVSTQNNQTSVELRQVIAGPFAWE